MRPEEALRRAMGPLRRRVAGMVARAVIRAIDDDRRAQSLQLDVLDGETHDMVERFQEYGLTSRPHPGAEAVVVFAGGLRSHGLVIGVEDRRYRVKGLKAGEVMLYDDLGQAVHLSRDGIRIVTGLPLTIEAESVLVDAAAIDLGGEGGQAVARVGDHVVGGVITEGSSKVRAAG